LNFQLNYYWINVADPRVVAVQGSRTLWVVSIHPWRRTPWVVGVLGEGCEGLSERWLSGQSRQQSASSL